METQVASSARIRPRLGELFSKLKQVYTDFKNTFLENLHTFRSRSNSVSIVSDYGLDDRAIEFDPRQGRKDFYSNLCFQTGSEAHPASCAMGTGVLSPGGKARPGRDANHSPFSSAEVVNE
jgi:hypothetical protein